MIGEKNWLILKTNPRAEKTVAQKVATLGLETFVPTRKEMHQWSDRKKMVESPLINGYVFVKPNPQQRDAVLQEQGVLQGQSQEG